MVPLLIFGSILCNSLQTVCTKKFTKEENLSPIFYSMISASFSLVYFLILSKFSLNFDILTIICSVLCALGAIGSYIGNVMAVKTGPLSISGLIQNFSLAVPTLYGIAFLKEPMGQYTLIGLILVVVSLILTNYQKESFNVNVKWLIWIGISFIGNSLFATVQKLHQFKNDGQKANELMVLALAIVSIFLLLYVIIKEKANPRNLFKIAYLPAGHGILNGVANMCLLLLAPIASA